MSTDNIHRSVTILCKYIIFLLEIFMHSRLFCVNVEAIEPQLEHCDNGYKCDCQHEWNGKCFGVCVPEFDDVVDRYANVLKI